MGKIDSLRIKMKSTSRIDGFGKSLVWIAVLLFISQSSGKLLAEAKGHPEGALYSLLMQELFLFILIFPFFFIFGSFRYFSFRIDNLKLVFLVLPFALTNALRGDLREFPPYGFQFIFLLVLLVATCEEVAFRGLIYDYLERYGRFFSVCSSSLIFCLLHFPKSFFYFLFILNMGIAFSFFRIKYQSLLPLIVAHFFLNYFDRVYEPGQGSWVNYFWFICFLQFLVTSYLFYDFIKHESGDRGFSHLPLKERLQAIWRGGEILQS